ncbi:unnamed protein product [Spodoptera littoralis]|uniref:Uncharacterized protein n=1 Tax=Spodoptera littoralis TaxID=7109 RepID=A0A9P0IH26_SPOLI|nr:unnamed protein product [Spodoptera littoralis]CAH1646743.1 unnamed protein product [Spodoptera littoralis]
MSIMITILHFDDLFTPLAPYLHQVNNKPHLQNMSYGDHISFVIDRNLSSEVYMKEIYLYEKQELTLYILSLLYQFIATDRYFNLRTKRFYGNFLILNTFVLFTSTS